MPSLNHLIGLSLDCMRYAHLHAVSARAAAKAGKKASSGLTA